MSANAFISIFGLIAVVAEGLKVRREIVFGNPLIPESGVHSILSNIFNMVYGQHARMGFSATLTRFSVMLVNFKSMFLSKISTSRSSLADTFVALNRIRSFFISAVNAQSGLVSFESVFLPVLFSVHGHSISDYSIRCLESNPTRSTVDDLTTI